MTREEAIKKLEPFIPSLSRQYNRWEDENIDKTADKSWLWRDEHFVRPSSKWDDPHKHEYMPERIPEHFLEGLETEIDGEKYVVRKSHFEQDCRRVHLDVTDFADYGNTHKYGVLHINGVHWSSSDGATHWWNKLTDVEPRVKGKWDVDLFRIVGEGEMSGSECPVGDSTARFVYLDELIATAAYVTLLRVEGPIVLDNTGTYASVIKKDDILLTVNRDGNVEWGNKLKNILKI